MSPTFTPIEAAEAEATVMPITRAMKRAFTPPQTQAGTIIATYGGRSLNPEVAYDRGADAFRAGLSRRACPGELRTTERHTEALAWARGFDEAAKQAKA